jgi:hypothetical protein
MQMTATFDVRAFNRHTGDVATALLSAIDVSELEQRETALTEREAEVSRRERAVERVERIHELKGIGAATAPVRREPELEVVAMSMTAGPNAAEPTRRYSFQDAFRLREIDWWTKVLGVAPSQP